MFGGQIKSWEQKTKGDIIATMTAFVILGGFIITETLAMALRERSLFMTIWCVGGSSYVAVIIVVCLRGGITELRRRQKSIPQNREHQPPR
jgi:hypothetical protein